MPVKLVNIDRDTPFLMPPDLRDWVAADDSVHFIIEAVNALPDHLFHVNTRGSGSKQYPPKMMMALLAYCYSRRIVSSRRIEEATRHHVAVRLITGNHHPDHDTIAAFRRNNGIAFKEGFVQVLLLAQEIGMLHVGTVSVDGTQIKANASKDQNVRYDRSLELIKQLEADVTKLLEEAEAADRQPEPDDRLPAALQKRQKLLEKIKAGKAALEQRARERAQAALAEHEEKLRQREASSEKRGRPPQPPPPVEEAVPRPDEQVNLTDSDSRLCSKRGQISQSYNAQAAVDAEGSMLILAALVVQGGDMGQLVSVIDAIDSRLGRPSRVLADAGYAKADDIRELERRGMDPHVAVGRMDLREYEFRPKKGEAKPPRHFKDPTLLAMKAKLESDEGRSVYRLRQQTVEPAFGTVKEHRGFRQFGMRGLPKASSEWDLTSLAYNLERIHRWQEAR